MRTRRGKQRIRPTAPINTAQADKSVDHFGKLPPEIRNQVYHFVIGNIDTVGNIIIRPKSIVVDSGLPATFPKYILLPQASKLFRLEISPMLEARALLLEDTENIKAIVEDLDFSAVLDGFVDKLDPAVRATLRQWTIEIELHFTRSFLDRMYAMINSGDLDAWRPDLDPAMATVQRWFNYHRQREGQYEQKVQFTYKVADIATQDKNAILMFMNWVTLSQYGKQDVAELGRVFQEYYALKWRYEHAALDDLLEEERENQEMAEGADIKVESEDEDEPVEDEDRGCFYRPEEQGVDMMGLVAGWMGYQQGGSMC